MSEPQIYGFMPCEDAEFPPEMMVGETVFDYEGKAIGWIAAPDFCAENARLRELVRDLAEFMSTPERLQFPEFVDRMRELGIEVD